MARDLDVDYYGPDDYEAARDLDAVLARGVGRFSVVPRGRGFAAVADGVDLLVSTRCSFGELKAFYIRWCDARAPVQDFPGRLYWNTYRYSAPDRFVEVRLKAEDLRIDFRVFVPMVPDFPEDERAHERSPPADDAA